MMVAVPVWNKAYIWSSKLDNCHSSFPGYFIYTPDIDEHANLPSVTDLKTILQLTSLL